LALGPSSSQPNANSEAILSLFAHIGFGFGFRFDAVKLICDVFTNFSIFRRNSPQSDDSQNVPNGTDLRQDASAAYSDENGRPDIKSLVDKQALKGVRNPMTQICTMKCPHCGSTAIKAKPEQQFKCDGCGWKL
jgi:hypothetical protein